MNLWITIPTNGERITIAVALSSILLQKITPVGVIICENGEALASSQCVVREMIKFLRAKGVKIIIEFRLLPPEGFTLLRHELLLSCQKLGATHVLMLDDDAMLGAGALDSLCSIALSNNNFGWASPVLLYPESHFELADTLPVEWEPILTSFKGDTSDEVLSNTCPMAATTCLLIDVENSLQLGGFDFYEYIRDFGEDRFFTARFWGKYETFVHRGAVCYVTSGMRNEGKKWKIPANKLFLREELLVQLDPRIINFFKSGKLKGL